MIEPKEQVLKLDAYSPPTSGRENMLRLDFNENTIGCSPKVIQALREVDADKLSIYPEYGDFLEKLAQFVEVSPQKLVLTNGTDEAINVIMGAFVEKGDEVIIPVPTFAMFKFYATLAGADIKEVLYNSDLSFPFEQLMSQISINTKLIVLVNPNNPTGSAISEEQIEKIIQKAQENASLVLVDEAYSEFYGKSSVGLVAKYDNLFVTRTFSKAFGLAGLRLGYIVGNEGIVEPIKKSISPYSVNTIALVCASAAIEDIKFVNEYVKEVVSTREIIIKQLNSFGIKTYPSSANFVLGCFGEQCEKVYLKLKEKGILVRNRTKDPLLEGCLRIGIGTKEQCNKLLKELKGIMEEIDSEGNKMKVKK